MRPTELYEHAVGYFSRFCKLVEAGTKLRDDDTSPYFHSFLNVKTQDDLRAYLTPLISNLNNIHIIAEGRDMLYLRRIEYNPDGEENLKEIVVIKKIQ